MTYSSSAAVRSAMIEADFYVGRSIDENGKIIGTVAAKKIDVIKHDLTEYDLELLKTRAGIFYRDSNLNSSAADIIARREYEVNNSDRMTSSRFKKLYEKQEL